MNCIVCELLVPELEYKISRLELENRKLRIASDPLNPSHRDKFFEMERRVAELESTNKRLLDLLERSEPAPDIYVDIERRSLWKKEKALLKSEHSG